MKYAKVLLVAVCLSAVSVRGELLYEFFDDSPLVPITAYSNWTNTPGTTPGMVTNTRWTSASQSVELPSGASGSSMIMVGDDPYVWSTADHPVIRLSAQVFCEQTNQTVQMIAEDTHDNKLVVTLDGADGHIKLDGSDTGAFFVTNRFADLVLYYDMVDDVAALDYNGANIQTWTAISGTVNTQFTDFGFHRLGTGGTGEVFIDNMFAEIYPASTVAWWRFEEGEREYTAERTGRFPPCRISEYGDRGWRQPEVDLIYDGRSDVPDLHVYKGPILETRTNSQESVVMTNWTVEGVAKILPDATYAEFMHFGVGNGFNDTNSQIDVSWLGSAALVTADLRDNNETTSGSQYLYNTNSILPSDGDWHHVALVKTNNQLIYYLDYQALATNTLNSQSSGTYTFGTDAVVRVGKALNGSGSTHEDCTFDEIRLSNGALATTNFLQSSLPIIVDKPADYDAATWWFEFMSIPGKTYQLEYKTILADGFSWTPAGSPLTATGHTTPISMPRYVSDRAVIRVLRK